MRLLVSVRSAAEIDPALAGGAEIIDAKEPSRGALGAVGPLALREITAGLRPDVPLSVALGDPGSVAAVERAIALVDNAVEGRCGTFVKLGFAGTGDPAKARQCLDAAMRLAESTAGRLRIVAVAYADHAAAAAPDRSVVMRMAIAAGACGILIDTYRKDGRDLFTHVGAPDLCDWIGEAAQAGLFAALAGSLSAAGVRQAVALPAQIVGVRGAACAGGREGQIDVTRVRGLRAALDSYLGPPPPSAIRVGERSTVRASPV